MKITLPGLILSLICACSYSQTKIVLDDKAGIINNKTDSLLRNNLSENNIELVSLVDFRKKCEYTFSVLERTENNYRVTIEDCNSKLIGVKDLGQSFTNLKEYEKVIILSYALRDILENPGVYLSNQAEIQPEQKAQVTESTEVTEKKLPGDSPLINHHSSRYVFTPTAYNLKKGELYYNTMYLFVHDAQYGVSDRFSIGMGTTLAGFPFYITPKATIFQGKNTAFAIGDILMIGTWGTSFIGNVAYGVLTFGNQFKNISLGAGHFYLSTDGTNQSNKAIFNVSSMIRLSDYFYFITENYMTWYSEKIYTYEERWVDDPYNDDPVYGWYDYVETGSYNRGNTLFTGITGIRFINKNKNIVSYQLGLAYLFVFPENIPADNNALNNNANSGGLIPMVSYTKKFGMKY